MKIKLVAILLAFFSIQSGSAAGTRIQSGWNLSSFQDNDGEGRWNFIIGIEKDWTIHKSLSFFSGLNYIRHESYLNNKTVKRYSFDSDVFIYNVNANVQYIDVPLGFLFRHPIYRKFGLILNISRSFYIAVDDFSTTDIVDQYLSAESVYDLSFTERTNFLFDNSGSSWNYGVGIYLNRVTFEYGYVKNLNELSFVNGLNIGKRFQAHLIKMGYRF